MRAIFCAKSSLKRDINAAILIHGVHAYQSYIKRINT